MKIVVSLFGEPKDRNLMELVNEYKKRTSRYQDLEFKYFKKYEGLEKFLELLNTRAEGAGMKVCLLAEKGEEFDTKEFAEKIYEKNLNIGTKEIMFCIGPAGGWGESFAGNFAKQNFPQNVKLLSLSKLTMQHDLAFLVLVEQIYRVVSIKNNLPYNK